MLAQARVPDEIKRAFASPPASEASPSLRWGEFVDAAVAAEMEMVSYGERPPLLHELRAGLDQAAEEAGPATEAGRWFLPAATHCLAWIFPKTRNICRFSISARLRPFASQHASNFGLAFSKVVPSRRQDRRPQGLLQRLSCAAGRGRNGKKADKPAKRSEAGVLRRRRSLKRAESGGEAGTC